MRIIFMGTPDFAVGTLEALHQAGHDICLAVTQPDKPKGRGKAMQEPPVKTAAKALGIPVFQPLRVRTQENVSTLASYQADVIVVIAFGQILPKSILELTPYGCINVHASLLPAYRGAAPIQWAILSGESVTGVTTMQMDEGIDTGAMLLKEGVVISDDDTGASLHDKLAKVGAILCVETLHRLVGEGISAIPQGETTTPYAKMLTKDMGLIDWGKSAVEIHRWIRGLNSWPGAYTHWDGKVLKIWQSELVADEDSNRLMKPEDRLELESEFGLIKEPDVKPGKKPGTVVYKDNHCFWVSTGEGVLSITEVQMPGKKRMETGAFLRGHDLKIETQL